jgi:hypothetical protein
MLAVVGDAMQKKKEESAKVNIKFLSESRRKATHAVGV